MPSEFEQAGVVRAAVTCDPRSDHRLIAMELEIGPKAAESLVARYTKWKPPQLMGKIKFWNVPESKLHFSIYSATGDVFLLEYARYYPVKAFIGAPEQKSNVVGFLPPEALPGMPTTNIQKSFPGHFSEPRDGGIRVEVAATDYGGPSRQTSVLFRSA
ncbi:MAG: hypothetical protein ACPG77_16850, partial [Nannocystaceae bacterium]